MRGCPGPGECQSLIERPDYSGVRVAARPAQSRRGAIDLRGTVTQMLPAVKRRPVAQCRLLAVQADGQSIETTEDLADGETLHPIQEAFIPYDA